MINSFTGEYYFLSNFYESSVLYDGIVYRNAEAAFQAQKTLDQSSRQLMATYPPNIAKRFGRNVELRPDWEKIKDKIMTEVVYAKFRDNNELMRKLMATGDEELIEGNTWHDNYWGDCYCNKCKSKPGKNMLGKILMAERAAYNKSLQGI